VRISAKRLARAVLGKDGLNRLKDRLASLRSGKNAPGWPPL
jgi:hypothetical protein